MLRTGEEILAEISSTLDQLIQNAEAIDQISLQSLERSEVEALQRTQASLIARILHMENNLDSDQKQELLRKRPTATETIQKKIVQFSRLNQRLAENMIARSKKPKAKKQMRLRKSRLKSLPR